MARLLTATPSSGEYEVLRALYAARGHDGAHVSAREVQRQLPTHTSLTDITTILDGESATYVNKSGSKYALTLAGVARSRANLPRRGRIGLSI